MTLVAVARRAERGEALHGAGAARAAALPDDDAADGHRAGTREGCLAFIQ